MDWIYERIKQMQSKELTGKMSQVGAGKVVEIWSGG